MHPDSLEKVAKAGYAAHGAVYFIVGGLAVADALGRGEAAQGTKGALLSILDSGWGALLLALVGVGLLCYAAWRLFQGATDADGYGSGAKGLAVRAGQLVSAVVHAALGVWALFAALDGAGASGDSKSDLAGWLMQQPYGPWLVGFVGVCIIGAGGAHFYKGATKSFKKWFDVDAQKMKLIDPVATTGLIARGIVFLIAGGLFVFAALTVDPQKAGGIRDALLWLRGLPFGAVLFIVIAVGLVSFGGYNVLEALYRRINTAQANAKPATRAT